MVLETKLDSSFPNAQFVIEGYSPPYDANFHGGGILFFIREDILARMRSTTLSNDFEGFFVVLNFRKKKFLYCCTYSSHKTNISSHLNSIGETMNIQMTKYSIFLIVGDFNSELSESAVSTFCEMYRLHNLVKSSTCSKTPG